MFNTRRQIFKRKAVRIAIGSLIDRKAIRCSILSCRAELAESLRAQDRPGPMYGPPRFDPAGARQILEADGWIDADGDGVRERGGVDLSFSLLLPEISRDLGREAVLVQRDFARAGIDMRIAKVSWSVYSSRLSTGLFDAAVKLVSTIPAFDPWSLFHTRAIRNGQNFGAFSDPGIDRLLDELQGEMEPRSRRDIEERLATRLGEEQPVVFTFRPYRTALVRGDLRQIRIRDGWFDERQLRRGRRAAREEVR